jgi:tetraacyldisaccharide 4'-kinase
MSTGLLARRLLLPLTPLYRLALATREWKLRRGWEPVRRLRFPVIGIGNLSTGGAGKTPFAIALARAFASRGCAVDVLSRGYGRRSVAPARVRPDGTLEEFGDEPLLIARETGVPVYVAAQRYEAGLLAESSRELPAGAEARTFQNPGRLEGDHTNSRVHILDDAFQHRQLHRDLDILLLNREDWQDGLLPAGNLREPLQAAKRATVIAIPAEDSGLEGELRAWGWEGPVWRLRRHMEVPRVDGPVLAFCGIARPEQFFAGLETAGLRVTKRIAFRDHHRYAVRDVERLKTAARTAGAAAFVTTMKDEIRLRAIGFGSGPDLPLLIAGLTIEIQDESAALDWLIARVREASPADQPL